MKSKVIFVRSFIPDFDGKVNKYFSALEEAGVNWHFLGWSRGVAKRRDTKCESYYCRAGKLAGGVSNVFSLLSWGGFVVKWLFAHRKAIEVVHAIDFDSAWPSFLFCALFRKKLVFDVYDKYTSVRNVPPLVAKLIDELEGVIIKKSDVVIFADGNRYTQHAISGAPNNIIVLENVPENVPSLCVTPVVARKPWKIGYFGVLEKVNRGIEDLVGLAVANEDIELHVIGYGPLAAFMSQCAQVHPNVYFHGEKGPAEGLEIMASMDIIAGLYYKTVPNHLFAAPNKYYEHLMLGRPLLTTSGVPPGDKVEANNTGWAVAEGTAAMTNWLRDLTPESIIEKSVNAARFWSANYEKYFELHYKGTYSSKIKSLLI